MATIVDCGVPVEEFALAETFASVPGLRVEAERFVAFDSHSAMPFVSATSDDFEAFEAALAEDPTVETSSAFSGEGGTRFYRVEWTPTVERTMALLFEHGGVLTRARSEGGSWRLRVLCPDRESLSRTYEACKADGLSLDVDSIYELNSDENARLGLTEPQHATLLEAKRRGYYDVPRDATLSELAAALGISHQALSERLRRGHANLISRTLAPRSDDVDGTGSPTELLN